MVVDIFPNSLFGHDKPWGLEKCFLTLLNIKFLFLKCAELSNVVHKVRQHRAEGLAPLWGLLHNVTIPRHSLFSSTYNARTQQWQQVSWRCSANSTKTKLSSHNVIQLRKMYLQKNGIIPYTTHSAENLNCVLLLYARPSSVKLTLHTVCSESILHRLIHIIVWNENSDNYKVHSTRSSRMHLTLISRFGIDPSPSKCSDYTSKLIEVLIWHFITKKC